MQIPEFESPENIFSDYLYFSSYSDLWLKHSAVYCQQMIEQFGLGRNSMVVEIASNDGYLLRNFVQRGIPALGIEPAANVAEVARAQGVPTEVLFFGVDTAHSLARKGVSADLMAANNVLAHVPDINDFVAAFRILLKPEGVATFEFPSLERLISERQFDTIYHEHFSYLSLLVVSRIFQAHGLRVFDVESLLTHGGSLRVYACKQQARMWSRRESGSSCEPSWTPALRASVPIGHSHAALSRRRSIYSAFSSTHIARKSMSSDTAHRPRPTRFSISAG